MKECKISTVRINERDELSFKVLVKREDYTDTQMQLMKNASVRGDLLDLEFTGLTSGNIEKQNKGNLVKLNGLMTTYCYKSGYVMQKEIERMYLMYKVKSRRDISPSNIESEIERYKAGLMEFN